VRAGGAPGVEARSSTGGRSRIDDEARVAEVLFVPSAAELRRRLPPCLAGIASIGVGIGLSVRAELGLAPWDVLHQGLSDVTGISIGVVVILVGIVVLLAWIPLRQKPGLGTLVNSIVIGLIADATLAVVPHVESMPVRIALLTCALLAFGLGGGLYIGSGLGPGPRDGLMTAITARGLRLWKVRTAMECTVLAVGFLLGGSIGVGTVVIALSLGPLTHFALHRFHLPVHDDAGEVLGE
jgi:uncharacterized membrane protein YczE